MAVGNARTLTKLVVVTLGMFGFGFALVPFYYKICEVTGINSGDEQSLVNNTQVDTSRWVTLD
jgi:cytochrome c oxidase assembly protein subunit 11